MGDRDRRQGRDRACCVPDQAAAYLGLFSLPPFTIISISSSLFMPLPSGLAPGFFTLPFIAPASMSPGLGGGPRRGHAKLVLHLPFPTPFPLPGVLPLPPVYSLTTTHTPHCPFPYIPFPFLFPTTMPFTMYYLIYCERKEGGHTHLCSAALCFCHFAACGLCALEALQHLCLAAWVCSNITRLLSAFCHASFAFFLGSGSGPSLYQPPWILSYSSILWEWTVTSVYLYALYALAVAMHGSGSSG